MIPWLFNSLVEKAYAANPPSVSGATAITPNSSSTDSVLKTDGVQSIIQKLGGQVLEFMTLAAGALAVLFLIYYGIQYIIAGGSADKTKAARAGIINAVIGIIVIVATYAIIRLGVSIGVFINSVAK